MLSRQATQRKIGNRTTERLLLGRFIFFHRVVGVFSFQDTSLERFNIKVSKPFSLNALYYLIPSSLYQVRTEFILSYFS